MAPPGSHSGGTPASSEQGTLSPSPSPVSPRRWLAASYESRFGGALFQDASPKTGSATPTPRAAKRPGVTTFTDPLNPFGRTASKQMTSLQEVRKDPSRAGARTRNPGVMAIDPPSPSDVPRSEDCPVRERVVPHRYGNQDWRPGKAAPTCGFTGERSPRGWNSEGVAEALGASTATGPFAAGWAAATQKDPKSAVLSNYLNDMKRVSRTRRTVVGQPSDFMQRMNDRRNLLPAEVSERRRASSADQLQQSTLRAPPGAAESTFKPEALYGFARKRAVSGRSAHTTAATFLHHEECGRSLPTTPRNERLHKAEQRFEEVVTHMKASAAHMHEQAKAFQERNRDSHQLLYSESVVKHVV